MIAHRPRKSRALRYSSVDRALSKEAQKRRRWMHSNIRLKLRYGIELSWEEYEDANDKFRTKQGVDGLRTNFRGDYEGWVRIRSEWIPCIFSVKDDVIATFFAKPPPRGKELQTAILPGMRAGMSDSTLAPLKQMRSAPQQQRIKDLELQVQLLETRIAEQRFELNRLNNQLTFQTSHAAELNHLKNQLASQTCCKGDVRWFKSKINEAKRLIQTGDSGAAWLRLDSITSLPTNYSPSKHLEEVEHLLQEREAHELYERALLRLLLTIAAP